MKFRCAGSAKSQLRSRVRVLADRGSKMSTTIEILMHKTKSPATEQYSNLIIRPWNYETQPETYDMVDHSEHV
jgi:hypothetical protein